GVAQDGWALLHQLLGELDGLVLQLGLGIRKVDEPDFLRLLTVEGVSGERVYIPSRKFKVCATFHDTMPPGRMPQFTSERQNSASSAAIAKSQAQTWVKPPPKQ